MKKKLNAAKEKIKRDHGCIDFCQECSRKFVVIDKMEESNVPVEYWTLTIDNFSGSPKLKEIVKNYILDIKNKYLEGKSICFSGSYGIGKTMSSICILRSAIKNGFSTYYITASDMLSEMTDFKNSSNMRYILKNVDFLVIDELDSRFFVSDSVKELFSGIYENVFRHRSQNLLPTIICTNETVNFMEIFKGYGVQTINSLNKKYLEIIPIIGLDLRNSDGR